MTNQKPSSTPPAAPASEKSLQSKNEPKNEPRGKIGHKTRNLSRAIFMSYHWPLSHWESVAVIAVSVASGFWLPWWSVALWAALAGGALAAGRSEKTPVALAALSGTSWFLIALWRDLETGARISTRIAAALNLPHASLLYIATFLVSAALAYLAALFGRLLCLAVAGAFFSNRARRKSG